MNFYHSTDILIVEDSATQAEQLRYTLEQQGFQVSVAVDGLRALESLRVNRPSLIITDVTMPEMDGYQLSREIRRDPALRGIPIILLTYLSEPEDVFLGLECGADNFLTKPYEAGNLISRIHYLLANRHLCMREGLQMGLEVRFAGKSYTINSDRMQILNLLLSTYETAVLRTRELRAAQDALVEFNEELERRIRERTAELQAEVEERRRAQQELVDLNAELERRVAERTGELEAANGRLQEMATRDGLTGLANRRHFDTVLGEELRRAGRSQDSLALIMCDVDYFKRYNDHYGHLQGDECLQALGGLLGELFRRAGELPARVGGEEFVVILPGCEAGDALNVAEKLRAGMLALKIPHERSEVSPFVSLSIGVHVARITPETQAATLLGQVDAALYRAKNGGRNRICMEPES